MSDWLLALGPWKPVLTALVLPPGGPLLLMLIGALLLWRQHRRTGWSALLLGLASLWLLSCQATAVWMSHQLLPQVAIQTPEQLRQQGIEDFQMHYALQTMSRLAANPRLLAQLSQRQQATAARPARTNR